MTNLHNDKQQQAGTYRRAKLIERGDVRRLTKGGGDVTLEDNIVWGQLRALEVKTEE